MRGILKNILVFAVTVGIVSTVLCATATAKSPQMRWKFATLAPKKIGWAKHIEEIVLPFVAEQTNDQLRIKVYWGGVMGDDEDYVKKMHIGQLQGAGLSGQGVTQVIPEMAVLQLPFMFRNFEEVDYIKKKMSGTFDGLAMERGYFVVAWVDQDFDQLYSMNNPMRTIEDFQGARMLYWYGPVEEDTIKALDALPVPMDVPSIPSASRQGLFDVSVGPALWYVGAQLYTVFHYVNCMKIRYSPALILVTLDAWQTLPPAYRENMLQSRETLIERFCSEVRKDNSKCLEAMCQYGVTRVTPTPKELERMKRATRKVWSDLENTMYPPELLEELNDNLAAYRGEGPAPARTMYEASFHKDLLEKAPAPAPADEPVEAVEVEAETEVAEAEPAPMDLAEAAESEKDEPPLEGKALMKRVQTVLQEQGYYNMKVDGLFGPRTYWGIKRYQKEHGLTATGAIDRPLLDSMNIR